MSQTQRSPRAHEHEEVTSHDFVSDPAEDARREEIRTYEATPLTAEPGQAAHAQRVVENAFATGSGSPAQRSAPKRQDFSNEKTSRKDTKIGDYFLGQTLGEGEFGKVKMGWKKDGIQVAVKLIRRDKLDNEARLSKAMREIDILKRLEHPNIVRLHETVKTERTIGIILEYASGGELFDHILHERYLKDPEARRLFSQLISGVGYLHQHGIIHRDLKLENLLLDRNNNIIITDFGFANTFDPNDELGEKIESKLHRKSFIKRHRLDEVNSKGFRRGDLMATSCGSPCYAAPELVVSDGIYTGRKVDVWSCGVILYAMLAGYLPFDDDPANPDGDNINLLYKYIVSAPLVFPEHVTPHARDLLRRILVPDPRHRADLFEVARHSWLAEYFHVVEKFTSKTAQDTPTSAAAAAMEMHAGRSSGVGRSSSVRESTKPHAQATTIGGLISKQGKVSRSPEVDKQKTARDSAKRRTVQIEYVAPQSQTTREFAPQPALADPIATRGGSSGTPRQRSEIPVAVHSPAPSSKSTRPARDVPRSISDSTAFNLTGPSSTTIRPVTTQGAISSSSKLPQRGSYGQPVAATVATENAQGRFSQPPPSRHNTGGSISQDAFARPQTARRPTREEDVRQANRNSAIYPSSTDAAEKAHRRTSTLSNFSDRLFGRSNSKNGRPSTATKEKPDRAYPPSSAGGKDRRYPPSSMRPVEAESAPRQSTESSRRSFGFSRKSIDLNKDPAKRSSKRFSLIPRLSSSHSREPSTRPQTADTATMMRPNTAGTLDGGADAQARPQGAAARFGSQYNYNRHSTYDPGYDRTPTTARTEVANASAAGSRITSGVSQAQRPATADPRRDLSSSYSTATATDVGDKFRADRAGYGSASKQKPSAGSRVMDFFKRRRHDRTGMA